MSTLKNTPTFSPVNLYNSNPLITTIAGIVWSLFLVGIIAHHLIVRWWIHRCGILRHWHTSSGTWYRWIGGRLLSLSGWIGSWVSARLWLRHRIHTGLSIGGSRLLYSGRRNSHSHWIGPCGRRVGWWGHNNWSYKKIISINYTNYILSKV